MSIASASPIAVSIMVFDSDSPVHLALGIITLATAVTACAVGRNSARTRYDIDDGSTLTIITIAQILWQLSTLGGAALFVFRDSSFTNIVLPLGLLILLLLCIGFFATRNIYKDVAWANN